MNPFDSFFDQEEEAFLDDVDLAILEERNRELRQIEEDTLSLSEIMHSISTMLCEQRENLEIAVADTEKSAQATTEAVTNLQQALKWTNSARGLIVDASAMIAGSGLGALGFLGGPLVGVPTLIGGIATASAVIVLRRITQ